MARSPRWSDLAQMKSGAKNHTNVFCRYMVRIPSSAIRRSQLVFAKLIERVLPRAFSGFDLPGPFFRPGSEVEEKDLWPSDQYPKRPILIEGAGISKPGRP